MKDSSNQVLYIGKAKNLRKRLSSYFKKTSNSDRERIPFLMKKVITIETIVVNNEVEALLLENNLIKKHNPPYNVLLKDDKTFFCLAISLHHPWPRIHLIRSKLVSSNAHQLIFGPYVSSESCKILLQIIQNWFSLRTCSDKEFSSRKRPCILYNMKKCLGPCTQLCSQEEYQSAIQRTVLFLKGDISHVIKELKQTIAISSKNLAFEKAASAYRSLQMIKQAMSQQNVENLGFIDTDALGLFHKDELTIITILSFRSGKLLGSKNYHFQNTIQTDSDFITLFILQYYENISILPKEILSPISIRSTIIQKALKNSQDIKIIHPIKGYKLKLISMACHNAEVYAQEYHFKQSSGSQQLSDLRSLIQNDKLPNRIECYDISHLHGSHAVGVYVVFIKNALTKQFYRTFDIDTNIYTSDYAMMEHILKRRLLNYNQQDLPEVIIIDGGKSHWLLTKEILNQHKLNHIKVIAIAKEKSNHSKGLLKEKIFSDSKPNGLVLPETSPLLHFIQKMRDEAHRFALNKHKNKRSKSMLSSRYKIPGIGEIKRNRLLKKFGSWSNIVKASKEELQEIKGLTYLDIKHIMSLQDQHFKP